MKTKRSLMFAAVLLMGAFGQLVGQAQAQSSLQGKFSLPYEVRWEKAIVPAGDYVFRLDPMGPASILTVQKINGPGRFGFLMMLQSSAPSNLSDDSRLLVVTHAGERFVRAMQLPHSGVMFEFAVPKTAPPKQMARAEGGALSRP